jgi:hypothetical protein
LSIGDEGCGSKGGRGDGEDGEAARTMGECLETTTVWCSLQRVLERMVQMAMVTVM